jgi:hypothetical protein
MPIVDAAPWQLVGERLEVEMRMTSRSRCAPHIRDPLDAVLEQERGEFLERVRRVADRERPHA